MTVDQTKFNIQVYYNSQQTETKDDDYNDTTIKKEITLKYITYSETTDDNGHLHKTETPHTDVFSSSNKMTSGNVYGYHNIRGGSEDRTDGGVYDAVHSGATQTFIALLKNGPYAKDMFDDGALAALQTLAARYGFSMKTDIVGGGRVYFVDTELEKKETEQTKGLFADEFGVTDKQLKRGDAGKSMIVGSPLSTIFNSDNKLSKSNFDKLSDSVKEAIIWGYNMGYFHEEIFKDDMIHHFEDVAKKTIGSEEDAEVAQRNLKDNLTNAGNTFNEQIKVNIPKISLPGISASEVLAMLSKEGGGIRNIGDFAFVLLTLASNMSFLNTQATQALMVINQNKEEFLHKKNLKLNEKFYDSLKVLNQQSKLAEVASHRKKRNFFQRIGDAFKKLFSKDFFSGLKDLVMIVVDLIPITYIVKLVISAVVAIGVGLAKMIFAIGKATGNEHLIKNMDSMNEITDGLLDGIVDQLTLSETKSAKVDDLKQDADEMEKQFNELSADDLEYITYADIKTFMDWENKQAEDATLAAKIIYGIVAAVGAILSFASGNVMGGVQSIVNIGDRMETMDANLYRINADYRIGQINKIMADLKALTGEGDAGRENIQDQIDLLVRDLSQIIEMLTSLEDDIDKFMETVLDMVADAAGSLMD